MAMLSANEISKKWQRNMSGAGDSIRAGVNAVTENPAEKAIARKDAWREGLNRPETMDRYVEGLQRVTTQSWKDSMINKGLPRLQSGVAAGAPKMESFMSELLPHIAQGQQMLKSTPRGSFETNMQRASMMAGHMRKFRRSR